MIVRLHRRVVASFLLIGSSSLFLSTETAFAESASTDILFTGTVPVTCAFEGLSPTEQLDPERVIANRQANCNEGTASLQYESTTVDSTNFPTSSEDTGSDVTSRHQQGIMTLTAQ